MEKRKSLTSLQCFIEEEAEKLAYNIQLVKTVDGLLIAIDSIVYDVREKAASLGEDPGEILRAILLRSECKPVLHAISCCRESIEALIETPRFRSLRPFKNIILEAASTQPCTGEPGIECLIPEPTWRKESYPTARGPRQSSRKWEVRVKVEKRLFGLKPKTLAFLAGLVVILALELVLLR